MTNAEAVAINTLCRAILGAPPYAGDRTFHAPHEHDVRDALRYLAERAYNHFHAGYSGRSVEQLWPDRPDLRDALERLVVLQSHYAEQLNNYDGGDRVRFADAEAWLARLRELKVQG